LFARCPRSVSPRAISIKYGMLGHLDNRKWIVLIIRKLSASYFQEAGVTHAIVWY
jgi:hypothetical protein